MTEMEWLACADPEPMLAFLRGKASNRKLILFTLACGSRNREALDADHERLHRAWEDYVEGLTSLDEVNGIYEDWTQGRYEEAPQPYVLALWDAHAYASNAADSEAEVRAQVATLRDLFGPLPFRPISVAPSWLAWSAGTVLKLAQAIYGLRAFDRLPILADALEDAGCTDATILSHLRSPGPHYRGCWPVDLLLAKS